MKNLARIVVLALVTGVLTLPPTIETIVVPEVVDATVEVLATPVASSTAAGTEAAGARQHSSEPMAAPIRFSMIGFELPDGVDELEVRTATPDGGWSMWEPLERIGSEDGPDAGTSEAAGDRSDRFTDPLWVGDATRFQVRFAAGAAGSEGADDGLAVRATVIDGLGLSGAGERRVVQVPGRIAEAASGPAIVSRAGWGANESWRRGTPSVSSTVNMTVVHHTAHTSSSAANSYSREEAPALIRSFYRYHTQTLGWSDIGYNALVDRFGTIYEGRAGGLERGVVGAHASGYNSSSFGVAVIGNFATVDASAAAYDSLVDVIAWKSAIHGMDPLGSTNRTAKGATLRTISGHRDMGQTACPGRIQDRLGWVRERAAARMGAFPPPQTAVRYPDVASDSPHRASVLRLDDLGIITGYGNNRFGPADPLTRGQMATIIARAFGLSSVQPDGSFRDVSVATGHAGNIHAVAAAGIVSGYADGTFRPDQPVRRDQMATFLARALELTPKPPTFADVSASNAHSGNIGALQAAGIATGNQGLYHPHQQLRRDQAASLIARALEQRP